MNKRTYNFLLEHAFNLDEVFPGVFFSENPELEFKTLLDDGYLAPVSHSGEFYANIGGARRLVHETIVHGKPRYYYIDEDETFELSPEEARHYRLNFTPFAKLIRRELKAQKGFTEMIAGKLWLCGQAGRQLRELYLTRNAGQDANIRKALFDKSVPQRAIVFQLGIPDNELSEKFTEQKVWNLTELLSRNESVLTFNRGPIDARIDDMCENKNIPMHRTGKEFLKAKKRVESLLVSTYQLYLDNARRAENEQETVKVPVKRIRRRNKLMQYQVFHDQATLASLAKITPKMMSQIKHEWEDFKTIDETHATYLLIFDFFAKQHLDSESVFKFHDTYKRELRDVGLDDDY